MPLVSVTRLRIRSLRFLPGFFWHAVKSSRQAQHARGFLGGQLSTDLARRTFWTLTAWTDESAMHAWRSAGAHRIAMPRLADWCDEAAVAHWQQADAALPGADEVLQRMRTEGRTSRVRHATPGHASGETVPDGRPPRFLGPLRPLDQK